VDPRASLDDVEKRKFLTLQGLEFKPLGRPAVANRYTDGAIPAPVDAFKYSLPLEDLEFSER
jgi:hypothetical protein